MKMWSVPAVAELNVTLTADGNFNNTVEGIKVPCTDLITGEPLPDCENISNKKCAS